MSRRSAYLAQRVRRNLRDKAWITYSHVTMASGLNPLPNPPRYDALVIDGNPAGGATSITLRAGTLAGRVIAGDVFRAGDLVLTAAADAAASTNKVAIPLTAPLASALSDGDVVAPEWSGDEDVRAIVTAYGERLADGKMIEARDLRVVISAAALKTRPTEMDKVRLPDGGWRVIVSIVPALVDGLPISYTLQVR